VKSRADTQRPATAGNKNPMKIYCL